MYYGYPDVESLRIAVVQQVRNELGNHVKVCTDAFTSEDFAKYSDIDMLIDRVVLDTEYWNGTW